ncbi:SEC-C metal-binding domain-containing protein [Pseudoalteromonas sp. B137]
MLVLLCDEIIDEYKIQITGKSLFDKQKDIQSSKSFRSSIIDNIDSVRDAGNKGAHSEQYGITYEEYQKLALGALKTFCTLVEDYWSYKTSKVPAYTFSKKTESLVKEWCYQALFNNDKNAKFEVAMALFNKYQEQFKDKDKYLIEQSSLMKSIDLIEEAARDLHPEALFEYSHIILNQIHRDKDIEKAKGYLHTSACRGFIKSKVAFGQLIHDSDDPHEDDIEEAVRFLDEAASDGESQAQFLLSQIYSSSKFGLKNDKLSSQWHEKSLKSENANSLFIQARSVLNNPNLTDKDVEKSLKLLELAIEKGSRDAYKLYLKMFSESSQPVEAVRPIYEDYLERHPEDYQQHLDFTEYLFREGLDKNDVSLMKESIKKLIQLFRYDATPTKIKRRLNTLSPKWLAKYDEAITLLGLTNKKHGELLLNFNPDGKIFDLTVLCDKLASVGENPKLAHKYFYKSIANKNVKKAPRKLGRNTFCRCGSGLKFKKCCA